MATILDSTLTREWYDRLPASFRTLDTDQHLWGFLRLLGDYAGGLALVVGVLEGNWYIRPILLTNGCSITLGDSLTVTDAEIDPATGGCVLPLDTPVTTLDPLDSSILVCVSGDWILTDVQTVPKEWLPWIAQARGIDLRPIPVERWRDWLEDPLAHLAGTLASLEVAASWHLLSSITPVVESTSQWEVTVTVPEAAITTTEAELLAQLEAFAAAGVGITLVLT